MNGLTMLELDFNRWAEHQFGGCELGDVRRTRRAVELAAQMAQNPSALTPDQTEHWADCKSAYRLFAEEDVTFAAVGEPHWQLTRSRSGGTWLLLNDTTSTDFGIHRNTIGLGPTGNGRGRGFLLHSALMVGAADESIEGLAGQVLAYRKPAPKKETRKKRLRRKRESQIWGELIDQIGAPPEDTRFVHVCDRGADDYQVFVRLVRNRCDWVIRARYLNRKVENAAGKSASLRDCIDSFSFLGTYQLDVRATKKQSPRVAQLEVRCGSIVMLLPAASSPALRAENLNRICMNVVEVREVAVPNGVTPLNWVLLTSLPVEEFAQAWSVIGYYEKRPLIEEFHKSLKTGCQLESRQFRSAKSIEPLTALCSVIAVRLLQLKAAARTHPNQPAADSVPRRWIRLLEHVSKRVRKPITTVHEFFRALAGLGGHLGRKSDGEPGWITLWRGLDKLILMDRGIQAYRERCG